MAAALERTFDRAVLGRTNLPVCRLGVAASYGVPARAVERAFEHGVNYFYWGTFRRGGFGQAIRNLAPQRDRFVLVIQSYSRVAGLLAWSLERALRSLRLDRADVLLLGLWNKPVPARILDAARRVRDRGLVRFLAVSSHNRPLVARLANEKDFDVIHFRYNAVHPGAERDIFPHLPGAGRPGMVAYTATNWGQLLRHAKIPKNEKIPAAADCYRFVLARAEVDVCMTGPANAAQMEQALEALRLGPMSDDELHWMRRVGQAIYGA
ncbi:MAG TPA: aldo/keto reductase [Bryobacteraceae bacterium]|nr:aldo/keto reductase [Bryobacteraceae bacterium]